MFITTHCGWERSCLNNKRQDLNTPICICMGFYDVYVSGKASNLISMKKGISNKEKDYRFAFHLNQSM